MCILLLAINYIFCSQNCAEYSLSFKKQILSAKDESAVPELFTVAFFDSVSDGAFSHQELVALTGLVPRAIITREAFLKNLERIRLTQAVNELHFTFRGNPKECFISCKIKCDWMIKSIKCEGVSTGKDEYLRLYELFPGEPFDHDMHQKSLQAIKDFLHKNGYRNFKVIDKIVYDHVKKWVSISLIIKKGKLVLIESVDLDWEKNNRDEKERKNVEKRLSRLVNKTCTEERIAYEKKQILKLLKNSGYNEIHISVQEKERSEKTVKLHFFISAKDKKIFTFLGNTFFSTRFLQNKIINLKDTDIFLPSLLMAQEVQQEYSNKRFYKAVVDCVDDQRGSVFSINEGPQCALKKIVFHGVVSFDEKVLEKMFFKFIKKRDCFDEKQMHDALEKIIQWYKKQGFWDAKIIRHDYLEYQNKDYAFFLKVVIQEGQQRFLSKIVIHGLEQEFLDDVPFYNELHSGKEPLLFPIDGVAQQKNFLIKKLKKLGFLDPKISYVLSKEDDGIGIVWTCQKGKKTTFGKTIVRGQTIISYDYLINLLSYKQGELYDKEKIQLSLTSLRSTGVFDRVTLFPSFKDIVDYQKDMILVIKDDDPFEVKLRMGFAQVSKNFYFKKGSTYTVGGSFIWKNPCALADKFSVDLDFNRFEQKINIAYRLPLLWSIPLATTFKGYANKYIQPIVIGSSKPLYRVLQQGFLVGLNKIGIHYNFGFTSGFEWMEINDIALPVAQAIRFKPDLVDKKIPYFFIEPMIYSDFLDDKINPTKGFFGAATLKGMFPFKESSWFVKFLGEQGMFVPVKSSVVAMRFRAGHIFRKDFQAIMPSERFFLGGPYSLRGYLQDYCPPLGTYINDKGDKQHVPQGGKTMLNANIEFRFPAYKKIIWGTLFQDFGMLLEDPRDLFTTAQTLAATGFGIRYLSPVGPLRFDIGWKWKKDQPEANSYAWFLTLGNSF